VTRPMSYDESGDLTYNPFAEDNDYLSESKLAQGLPTSSILKPSNPLSLSVQESVEGTTVERGKHNRSVPEISIVPESDGCLHPLKSALARQNDTALYDLGVTRPHLSRIINARTLINDNLPELDSSTIKTPSASDEETEVIVHKASFIKPSSSLFFVADPIQCPQVTSKDSLAGVSLRYGISLANLRKANQLWATDSIHIRDVLYIPIEQAFRAREFIPESQITSTSESPESGTFIQAQPIHNSSLTEERVESSAAHPLIPVCKMPSSKLTFFPPSSNKDFESKLNGPFQDVGTSLHLSESHKSPARSNSRYIPSPASNSLSSILTAFPIGASTRDEIITRLSFDSVSSSSSDRSRTNSDEDIGHELDDVTKHTSCEDVDEMLMSTPKALHHPLHSQILPSQQGSRITSSSSIPKNSHIRSLSSTSSPRFYVSQAYETAVRTYQMEPSPDMQLPNFKSHTVVHSSGTRAQEKTAKDSATVLRRKSRS
jgi:LysM repeat protein